NEDLIISRMIWIPHSCNANVYAGNSSVAIKLAAILCFQSPKDGKCSGNFSEATVK
ncbi:hypothetical protein BgiMline_010570, partial [Biomphalaria glabrata]